MWRKKLISKARQIYPNNNGNFYFINGTTPNSMYLPSLPQEGGEGAGSHPGQTTMNGNPVTYQPYFHPGVGDSWAVDRNGMNGVNVNVNVNPNANMSANAMAAQIDDFEDQEKRLFLEEFRYPGQHTVSPNPYSPVGFHNLLTLDTLSYSNTSLPAATTALQKQSWKP